MTERYVQASSEQRAYEEVQALAVAKYFGARGDQAHELVAAHQAKGHLEESDVIETTPNDLLTQHRIAQKLRGGMGKYNRLLVLGGDGSVNIALNGIYQYMLAARHDGETPVVPALVCGGLGTIDDGRWMTHGAGQFDALDLSAEHVVAFHAIETTIKDGQTVLSRRLAGFYGGTGYTGLVAADATGTKHRANLRKHPRLGTVWEQAVQAHLATRDLGQSPQFKIEEERANPSWVYDISCLNGSRLGGFDVGKGDLESASFLVLRSAKRRTLVDQATRLVLRNRLHLPMAIHSPEPQQALRFTITDIREADEVTAHLDGQPYTLTAGKTLSYRTFPEPFYIVAPQLAGAVRPH